MRTLATMDAALTMGYRASALGHTTKSRWGKRSSRRSRCRPASPTVSTNTCPLGAPPVRPGRTALPTGADIPVLLELWAHCRADRDLLPAMCTRAQPRDCREAGSQCTKPPDRLRNR